MNCEECLIVAEEYLEEELDLQFAEPAFSHIAECSECCQAYEYLQQERKAFSNYMFEVESSPVIRTRLIREIRREQTLANATQLKSLHSRVFSIFQSLRFDYALVGSLAILLMIGGAGFLMSSLSDKTTQSSRDSISLAQRMDTEQLPGEIINMVRPNQAVDYPSKSRTGENKNTSGKSETRVNNSNKISPPSFHERHILMSSRQTTKSTHRQSEGEAGTKVNAERKLKVVVSSTANQTDDLERETSKQVERAQLLLRSFRNTPLLDNVQAYDVSYDKREAQKLLQNNIVLRNKAETQGNIEIEGVLAELEPYLMDIANLTDYSPAAQIRAIKGRIKSEEIVASLQIYQP
ncbi:MAG TPA: hypothetical protein VGB02_00575 [Pyrinomonadaceae bacterium]|jgi:hypothetical protein